MNEVVRGARTGGVPQAAPQRPAFLERPHERGLVGHVARDPGDLGREVPAHRGPALHHSQAAPRLTEERFEPGQELGVVSPDATRGLSETGTRDEDSGGPRQASDLQSRTRSSAVRSQVKSSATARVMSRCCGLA